MGAGEGGARQVGRHRVGKRDDKCFNYGWAGSGGIRRAELRRAELQRDPAKLMALYGEQGLARCGDGGSSHGYRHKVTGAREKSRGRDTSDHVDDI